MATDKAAKVVVYAVTEKDLAAAFDEWMRRDAALTDAERAVTPDNSGAARARYLIELMSPAEAA